MDDSNTVKQEDSEGPDWHPANVQAVLKKRGCRSQVYRRRTATIQLRWGLLRTRRPASHRMKSTPSCHKSRQTVAVPEFGRIKKN